jgi:hypothetical protein
MAEEQVLGKAEEQVLGMVVVLVLVPV